MPWSSGVFTRANGATGWQDDAGNLIGIEAGRHDTQDNDFRDGINQTLTKDGASGPTANLPMAGFRHTGVGLATARDSYATLGQAQDSGATWGGTSGGSANAQTLTLTPAITAYVAGQRFRFIAGYTNTAATTLNINGAGVKSVVVASTGLASSYYITAGLTYEVLYDGTNFLLLNDPAIIKRGDYEFLGGAGGTANALTLTSTGPRVTTTAGLYKTFIFTAAYTNTAATTVAIDGLAVINITNPDNSPLSAGQLQVGKFYQLMVTNGSALLLNAYEAWQTFAPVITQVATQTYTNAYSYYKKVEADLVVWRFSVTITSATGTAGNQVAMTPPVAPLVANSYLADGVASIFDASANTIYTCVANFVGTTALRFYTGSGTVANHFGATPSLALGVGDIISGVITYRA